MHFEFQWIIGVSPFINFYYCTEYPFQLQIYEIFKNIYINKVKIDLMTSKIMYGYVNKINFKLNN